MHTPRYCLPTIRFLRPVWCIMPGGPLYDLFVRIFPELGMMFVEQQSDGMTDGNRAGVLVRSDGDPESVLSSTVDAATVTRGF